MPEPLRVSDPVPLISPEKVPETDWLKLNPALLVMLPCMLEALPMSVPPLIKVPPE